MPNRDNDFVFSHFLCSPLLSAALKSSLHLIVYPDPESRVPSHLPFRRAKLAGDDLDDGADRTRDVRGGVGNE
jgi:hypothetical protein